MNAEPRIRKLHYPGVRPDVPVYVELIDPATGYRVQREVTPGRQLGISGRGEPYHVIETEDAADGMTVHLVERQGSPGIAGSSEPKRSALLSGK